MKLVSFLIILAMLPVSAETDLSQFDLNQEVSWNRILEPYGVSVTLSKEREKNYGHKHYIARLQYLDGEAGKRGPSKNPNFTRREKEYGAKTTWYDDNMGIQFSTKRTVHKGEINTSRDYARLFLAKKQNDGSVIASTIAKQGRYSDYVKCKSTEISNTATTMDCYTVSYNMCNRFDQQSVIGAISEKRRPLADNVHNDLLKLFSVENSRETARFSDTHERLYVQSQDALDRLGSFLQVRDFRVWDRYILNRFQDRLKTNEFSLENKTNEGIKQAKLAFEAGVREMVNMCLDAYPKILPTVRSVVNRTSAKPGRTTTPGSSGAGSDR